MLCGQVVEDEGIILAEDYGFSDVILCNEGLGILIFVRMSCCLLSIVDRLNRMEAVIRVTLLNRNLC